MKWSAALFPNSLAVACSFLLLAACGTPGLGLSGNGDGGIGADASMANKTDGGAGHRDSGGVDSGIILSTGGDGGNQGNGGQCVPRTCAELSANCGPMGDGCGGVVQCGSCKAPATCGGGGKPSVCGGNNGCTPETCTELGVNCGPMGDGCGGVLQCGSCNAPETCGGGGMPSACGGNSGCVPKTCTELGISCGPAGDGCGGVLQCGSCSAPQTCGGGKPSVCGESLPDAGDAASTCVPKTCTELSIGCGPAGDGCGNELECGSCPPPATCGGGTKASVCGGTSGCVPNTCIKLGINCGPAGDGCGGQLDCGTCTAPKTCGGGTTSGLCGGSNDCVPTTCTLLGINCGPAGDGCGGLLDCGDTCPAGEICGGGTSVVPGVAGVCGPVAGVATGCTGLCLQQQACTGNVTTTISGTVYAPNGTDPLYNALVYVPNGGAAPTYGVTAFSPGVACGQCGSDVSGTPLVSTLSAPDGTFALQNVPVMPAGQTFPLVIQLGRWRRKIDVPAVPGCTNVVLTAAQTSLPSEEAEFDPADNIPLMAFSTGSVDALECVLLKIGINQNQFSDPVAQGGSGRVMLYKGEGSPGAEYSTMTPSATQLWNPATSAQVTGTTNVTKAALFGSTGTLKGLTLILNVNGAGAQTLTLSGTTDAASNAALLAAISAQWPAIAATSPGPTHFLVLADSTTGTGSTIVVGAGTANAALGLTAGTTSGTASNADIDQYDMVFFPCQSAAYSKTAAEQQVVVDYANSGGRVFATHYSYVWFIAPTPASTTWTNPFLGTADWDVGQADPADATGYINTSFARGQALAQWLQVVGASTTYDQMALNTLRDDFDGVVSPSLLWVALTAAPPSASAGIPMHYTFDTPIGDAPANQCGRALFDDFHVENAAITQPTVFPAECPSGAMTAQEKLLEFMIFDLSSCIIPTVTLPTTCTPVGCGSQNCGPAGDGCGNQIACGTCTVAGQTCGGGGIPGQCGGTVCAPTDCTTQGIKCGPAGDGCGNLLQCGNCPNGTTCGGGGKTGQCGASTCPSTTCAAQKISCGPAGDGCGNLIECGSCPVGETCGGGGVSGKCGTSVDASACTPLTCTAQKISCGPAGDGCGGQLACGTCPAGETCGGGGTPGVCGGSSCTPTTCTALGFNCGPGGDGCGGELACGTCPANESCGGGGKPGVCGSSCVPTTCTALHTNCGPAGDGCGGLLQCGTCVAPDTCGGGGVSGQCGNSGPK